MKQEENFDNEEFSRWKEEWVGMPEFRQDDLGPVKSLIVHFDSYSAMHAFSELIQQKITSNTRSIWFPPAEIGRYANKRYADES